MQTCAFTFRVDSNIPKFELSSQQPAVPMTPLKFSFGANITCGATKWGKRPIKHPKSRLSIRARLALQKTKNKLLLVDLPPTPEETINSKQDPTFPFV